MTFQTRYAVEREWDQRHDPMRRRFVNALLGASAATCLSGCVGLGTGNGSCDSSGPESIDWIPDVAHPVFFGVSDVTTAEGAPRDNLIYYPAATFRAPPILKSCIARWPIVLFLPGHPPLGVSSVGYYRRWWRVPSALARCGYVVIVPNQSYSAFYVPSAQDVVEAMANVDWVRHQWSGAKWIDQRPGATAVAGHSDGAMLAAAVAAATPEISAMVSLSGVYPGNPSNAFLPSMVRTPSFYMWSRGAASSGQEDLDGGGIWNSIQSPKYGAVYDGDHFDYLEPGDSGVWPRGSCPLTGGVASDLVALFISANLASLTQIPIDLAKPHVVLTPRQRIFADSTLLSIDEINGQRGCSVDLRWEVDASSGQRHLGP